MDQEKNKTKEEAVDPPNIIDAAPSSDEKAEEIKGSDADIDLNVGFDKQPSAEEAAEELKGSDADLDKLNELK